MPQGLTDDESTLVQAMAWCLQATSHYLSQCWLNSLSPYGVASAQWVNVANCQLTLMMFWAQRHHGHGIVTSWQWYLTQCFVSNNSNSPWANVASNSGQTEAWLWSGKKSRIRYGFYVVMLHNQLTVIQQKKNQSSLHIMTLFTMGLLPDTKIAGCACAGNAGNVFPATAGYGSRHASRHVRHARAVMHAGIDN